MQNTKAFTLLAVGVLISVNLSIACDCIMTPIESHVRTTNFIMKVKVVEILDTQSEVNEYRMNSYPNTNLGFRPKVRITNILKGKLENQDLINIESNFTNCELLYKIGKEYLLFLEKQNGKYYLRTCSYSEEVTTGRQFKKLDRKIRKLLKNKLK